MVWWVWVVAGIALLVAEVVISADFYLVFLGLAAIVVGLLSLIGVALPAWGEWFLFAAITIVGAVVYQKRWKRRLFSAENQLAPELVGEIGTSRGVIPGNGRGKVEVRGAIWDALNDVVVEIPGGARCRVERVDGLTLVVRPDP